MIDQLFNTRRATGIIAGIARKGEHVRIFILSMCLFCSIAAADIPASLQAQIDAYGASTVKAVEAFNKATDANREKLTKAVIAAKAGAKPEQVEMFDQVMASLIDGEFDKQTVDLQRYRITPAAWTQMVTLGLDGKPEVKLREQILEMDGVYRGDADSFIIGYLSAGTIVGVKCLSNFIRANDGGRIFDADAPGNLCMDLVDPDRSNCIIQVGPSPGRTVDAPAALKVAKSGVYRFRLAVGFGSRTVGVAAFKVKLGGF